MSVPGCFGVQLMPTKTERARKWAKENFDSLQLTATPCSEKDLTQALFHIVDTYKGGDSRLFLYSQTGDIFFFNINSSRNDVKDLVGKVASMGGLVFGSQFDNGVAKFLPIMAIKPVETL